MTKILVTIGILWSALGVMAQHQLKGFAPGFLGEKVELYATEDYVTGTQVKIGEATVNPADSSFVIPLKNKGTLRVRLEIDQTQASLYLAPETSYNVYFPKVDGPVSYRNTETNLYFADLDSTDINYRILQYHDWFDMYVAYHDSAISRGGFLAYLDTFKLYAADAYKHVDDVYFITYVRYDLAEMEQAMGGNRQNEARLNTYMSYIEPFPVYSENDRYMKFVLAFYDKEFGDYLPDTEASILMAVRRSSPTRLMKALKSDLFLVKPELRELIMIDKLGKMFYHDPTFRPNILTILDSVAGHALTPANAITAKNVKNYITRLEQGYPAPHLGLDLTAEEKLDWMRYKGKFVYMNFFATWNKESVNDMDIIADLVRKYGNEISFLSICTDPDQATFDTYIKDHPDFQWDIVYAGEDENLLRAYETTGVPNYFLIDQEGFIVAAPALGPSPDGEYESIEKTLFSIQEALNPRQRRRN